MRNKELIENNHNEYLKAAIIIYSNHRKEIWLFGDCRALVNGKLYSAESKMDEALAEVRSVIIQYELSKGKTIAQLQEKDPDREYILPILQTQPVFENKKSEYGFNVLNGQEIDLDDVRVVKVDEGDMVVLASDGYPHLEGTLQGSEDRLAEVLERDPLCYLDYKSTKGVVKGNVSFDDRAYVRFVV